MYHVTYYTSALRSQYVQSIRPFASLQRGHQCVGCVRHIDMLKQDVDVKPDELELFKTLTADDVCVLYAKMTTALTSIRDPDTAKDQRVRLFTPIKAEIKAMAAASAVRLPPITTTRHPAVWWLIFCYSCSIGQTSMESAS